MSERRATRRPGLGGRPLSAASPLLGGPLEAGSTPSSPAAPRSNPWDRRPDGYDPQFDQLADPARAPARAPAPSQSAELPIARTDPERELNDWGRSERVVAAMDPVLNFYYRYWFRVEAEGLANVPDSGGALLVANHSGALPPDAPMIMQALRSEHGQRRAVHMLGEHWFKGYPLVGMLANKLGLVPAHPANAQRLLADEGRLVLVFPEGQKGTSKVAWQRYRLRRFGRGGFVRTALRARAPIIPIAVVGGEEAMPIFAHMRTVQRLTGLIYAPLNHAFPHLGPLAALAYMPAKFRIRFLTPIDLTEHPPETIDDAAAVQEIAEQVRERIASELGEMLAARRSVWLG